jgi:hypothetical protein
MRFESSFTNVLNHSNFAPPATQIDVPSTFGVLSAPQTAENAGNRTGQLASKSFPASIEPESTRPGGAHSAQCSCLPKIERCVQISAYLTLRKFLHLDQTTLLW